MHSWRRPKPKKRGENRDVAFLRPEDWSNFRQMIVSNWKCVLEFLNLKPYFTHRNDNVLDYYFSFMSAAALPSSTFLSSHCQAPQAGPWAHKKRHSTSIVLFSASLALLVQGVRIKARRAPAPVRVKKVPFLPMHSYWTTKRPLVRLLRHSWPTLED